MTKTDKNLTNPIYLHGVTFLIVFLGLFVYFYFKDNIIKMYDSACNNIQNNEKLSKNRVIIEDKGSKLFENKFDYIEIFRVSPSE